MTVQLDAVGARFIVTCHHLRMVLTHYDCVEFFFSSNLSFLSYLCIFQDMSKVMRQTR